MTELLKAVDNVKDQEENGDQEIKEDQELTNYLGEILIDVLNDEIEETTEDFLREGNVDSENS